MKLSKPITHYQEVNHKNLCMSTNNNYLLKQQITNLKKQANKRYHSTQRQSGNNPVPTTNVGAYGSQEPIVSQ